MEKEYLTKQEAENKFLTKEEFDRELHMKDYLQIYQFNQFLIGIAVAVFIIWSLGFYSLGMLLLELVIVIVFIRNWQQNKKGHEEYNKHIQEKRDKLVLDK